MLEDHCLQPLHATLWPQRKYELSLFRKVKHELEVQLSALNHSVSPGWSAHLLKRSVPPNMYLTVHHPFSFLMNIKFTCLWNRRMIPAGTALSDCLTTYGFILIQSWGCIHGKKCHVSYPCMPPPLLLAITIRDLIKKTLHLYFSN